MYAIEKRINFWSTFLFLMLVAIPTGKMVEMLTFWGSVTMLRRRIGGWHAKEAWSCHLISIGSVLIILFIIGPVMEQQHLWLIMFFDVVILFACLAIQPKFPPQLHFSPEVVKANNSKKTATFFNCCNSDTWPHFQKPNLGNL